MKKLLRLETGEIHDVVDCTDWGDGFIEVREVETSEGVVLATANIVGLHNSNLKFDLYATDDYFFKITGLKDESVIKPKEIDKPKAIFPSGAFKEINCFPNMLGGDHGGNYEED